MKPEPNGLADVLKALASIQDELARLGARVAALETAGLAAPSTATNKSDGRASAPPSDGAEPLSEEIVLVLGAAVAAFLGKKARVRGIQLLGSSAWAQQGRVTIQASHALNATRSQS